MRYQITSRFMQREGFRSHGHSGIDFYMPEGTPLRSIKDGVISKITHYNGYNIGNGVLVKWEDGKTAIYGHMSKVLDNLHVGDKVSKGDLLGYSGHSGHVLGKTGNHLHFGLKENGHFIDPSSYIDDIQNMNVKQFVQHIPTPEPTQLKLNFFDYMNQHMHVLSDLKLHLIHLANDTLLIQIPKQLLQFISIHASFLNCIISHLF
jgi:hypothetical protein